MSQKGPKSGNDELISEKRTVRPLLCHFRQCNIFRNALRSVKRSMRLEEKHFLASDCTILHIDRKLRLYFIENTSKVR